MKIKTNEKVEFINITPEVKKFVKESKISDGACLVYTTHTTSGITINENEDPNIVGDIIKSINKIVKEDDNYEHNKVCNNAAAHIRASIIGPSELIPIENNELQLGTYQDIFFCEFDGPRDRTIILKIIREDK